MAPRLRASASRCPVDKSRCTLLVFTLCFPGLLTTLINRRERGNRSSLFPFKGLHSFFHPFIHLFIQQTSARRSLCPSLELRTKLNGTQSLPDGWDGGVNSDRPFHSITQSCHGAILLGSRASGGKVVKRRRLYKIMFLKPLVENRDFESRRNPLSPAPFLEASLHLHLLTPPSIIHPPCTIFSSEKWG